METAIRPAVDTDIPLILPLWCEMMDLHAALDSRFARAGDGDRRFGNYLGDLLSKDDTHLIVAETNETIVGYALGLERDLPRLFRETRYGSITDLAVRGDCRGHGVGTTLYNELCNRFRHRGIRRIELNLVPANRSAERFWSAKGFRPFMESRFLCLETDEQSEEAL